MTPLEVRARIESLLRASASTDPSAAAMLSRMPRPRCGTMGCAGKLSRNTGKCSRCGAAKTVDRYTRGDGTHFDRDRDREREKPLPQTVQPGITVLAEQAVEKPPAASRESRVNIALVPKSTKEKEAVTP